MSETDRFDKLTPEQRREKLKLIAEGLGSSSLFDVERQVAGTETDMAHADAASLPLESTGQPISHVELAESPDSLQPLPKRR